MLIAESRNVFRPNVAAGFQRLALKRSISLIGILEKQKRVSRLNYGDGIKNRCCIKMRKAFVAGLRIGPLERAVDD